jgi:hypothetical protein
VVFVESNIGNGIFLDTITCCSVVLYLKRIYPLAFSCSYVNKIFLVRKKWLNKITNPETALVQKKQYYNYLNGFNG